MATISLYEELLGLFRRFAENGGEAPENRPVIDIWRTVLGAEDQTVLRVLALVRSGLQRAREQINHSSILDAEDKSIAVEAMDQLDGLINPTLFHRSFADVAEHVSRPKLSMLVLLANSLQPEFPEPSITREDVEHFTAQVAKLREEARSSNHLDPVLKSRLAGHLDYIQWSIRSFELTGVEALYAAFGPALLFLRHEVSRARGSGDLATDPRNVIGKQLEDLFRHLMRKLDHQTGQTTQPSEP
ncbi:MAG: hypothetical protein JO001_17170 [Alphaproteobacteria bacterium]|nr:hypothetical protein [Alphaproteobacteria bacterium]